LVALKRRGEDGCSAANNSAHGEKLKRNLSIQQRRPLDTQLHVFSHVDYALGDNVLRNHQEATTAHVDRAARARKRKFSGKRAEANAQVQWIAKL
jgi:hypothetical protein